MTRTVDVLMPLRHSRFIRGDVIAGLLRQDTELHWYVDARADLELSPEALDRLGDVSSGPFWHNHMHYMAKILAKRNRLRHLGESEFVYLADADVILPEMPVLPGMLEAFARFPVLGATGVIYAVDWPHVRGHTATGSMLLRRQDLEFVGELRGAPCECSFIRNRLLELGKRTIPLTRVHAHQWKRTLLDGDRPEYESEEGACPLCGAARNMPDEHMVDIHCQLSADGQLDIAYLRDLLRQHGERFRLFPSHGD